MGGIGVGIERKRNKLSADRLRFHSRFAEIRFVRNEPTEIAFDGIEFGDEVGFPVPIPFFDCLLYTSPSPRDRG